MKQAEEVKCIFFTGLAVLTVAAASLYWITLRRAGLLLLSGYSSGSSDDVSSEDSGVGNVVAGVVQGVIDTGHNLLGMQYFNINELTRSSAAKRLGIDNSPSPEIRRNLEKLITGCLDPIRSTYGKPILVASGYRCPELNAAVGGAKTSQHLTGCAADLVPAYGGSLEGIFRAAIQVSNFDQLIIEQVGAKKWVHVGCSDFPRRQILAYKGGRYTDISGNWQTYIQNYA